MSPTTAKLRTASEPPPGPTVPPELEELVVLLDEDVEEVEEDVLDVELLEVEPPQDCPQTEETSPTHCASHWVEQQYASLAHTIIAHGSQLAVSLPPGVQMACAQPPPDELEELLELDDALELDELLEHD